MPPDTKAISVPGNGELVKISTGAQRILGYYAVEGVGFALAKSEWDVEEEIETLILIARDGSNPEKLAAMRQLDLRVKEVAELNGLITRGSVHVKGTDSSGNEVQAVQTASRLLTTIQEDRPTADGAGPFAGRTVRPIETTD